MEGNPLKETIRNEKGEKKKINKRSGRRNEDNSFFFKGKKMKFIKAISEWERERERESENIWWKEYEW